MVVLQEHCLQYVSVRALLSGVDAVVVLQEHCLQYVSVRALLSGVDAVVVLQEHCLQYVSVRERYCQVLTRWLCYRSTVCSMLV